MPGMRPVAVAALLCAACGAQVAGEGDDDPAIADAAPNGPDGPPPIDGAPDFIAQCAAKGYAPEVGLTSQYRAVATGATWLAAEAACAADVPGATHLVVLSSTAEVDFIKARLGWVGLSDRATEDTFVNVTLEPMDLRPFLNGQPDDGNNSEDCVQMKAGGLDDDQCGNSHIYVCECDGRPEA
jgi:hypothetical protein